MKAEIDTVATVTVKLTMSKQELQQVIGGLGATSPYSREVAGMSPEQSTIVGRLFYTLSTSLRNSV